MLGLDKSFDVGMVASEGSHHGPAARARAHDGAAHGIPYIHEGKRARGIGADASNRGPLGTQGRKIVADTTALLHGQRGFLEVFENARHVVGDGAHDEAVEQGHFTAASGTGDDAARR